MYFCFLFPDAIAFEESDASNKIVFYNWDFEASLADSVEGLDFMTGNNAATDIVAQNGNRFARVPVNKPAVTYVKTLYDALYTSKSVRYVVMEFDFKKDTTSSGVGFHTRGKTTNNRSVINWYRSAMGWNHYRVVFDTSNDINSSYSAKVYCTNSNGKTTETVVNSAVRDIYDFRVNTTDVTGYVYFDNFRVTAYSTEYQAFNPYDMKDPNHTSDESFFGVWNSNLSEWTTTPVLQYSLCDGLSGVELAAKKGDYKSASEELMKYYKAKSGNDILTYTPNTSDDIKAEAMLDKIWGYSDNGKLLASAEIEPAQGWYSIDLTGMSGCTNGTYYIMDSNMDDSSVEIVSKENSPSNSAYVEVTSGGITTVYPVVADTYISPMDNACVNFGREMYLYSREDAADLRTPFSSDTQRAYLKFDFPDNISSDSEIKLNIYARATGTKNKKIYVLSTQNERDFDEYTLTWAGHYPQAFCFKETGFVWDTVDTCDIKWKTEYEWINYSTRLYQNGWLLQRYLATGNEDYALCALEVAMSQYTQMPDALYPRALEGGWRTENLIKTIYTSLSSKYMTPDVLKALLKWVYNHGVALKDTSISTTNQDSAVKVNFARICAYFPEVSPDNWWQSAKENLNTFYTRKLLNDDGSYTEACTNYISGVISEFIEVLKLVGIRDGTDNEYYILFKDKLNQLATYYANLNYPGVGMVPFGDGGRGLSYSAVKRANEYLNDEELAFIAGSGTEGVKPSYTTRIYPSKSVVMFKSDWSTNGLSAFFNNDGGGSHGHFDDLSLDVSAFGKYLLVDAGVSSYSEGSVFAQNRKNTIYHNTIEIDNSNQKFSGGNAPGMMNLKTNATFDWLKSDSDNKMYAGFDVNRNVLMLKNKFIIVSDSVIPYDENPHTYRQAWHPDYNTNLTLDPITGEARTNYANSPNIRMIPAQNGESAKIFDRMMVNPVQGETTSKSVQYYRENVTGVQTFDTVLYPEKSGENANIRVTRTNLDVASSDATAFEIEFDDTTGHYFALNDGKKASGVFGNFETDADMAYVEVDSSDSVTYIALSDAARLMMNGNVLVSFENMCSDFSASFDGKNINLYVNDADVGKKITIAADSKYRNVYLNGTPVEYEYSDGLISTQGIPQNISAPFSAKNVYYSWDFEGENGLLDTVSQKPFMKDGTVYPELSADEGNTFVKVTWKDDKTLVTLTPELKNSLNTTKQERYLVWETDFWKDATNSVTYFGIRGDRPEEKMNFFEASASKLTPKKYVMVLDTVRGADGKFTAKTFEKNNDDSLTFTGEKSFDYATVSDIRIRHVFSSYGESGNLYMDNVKISAMTPFYEAVNRAKYSEDIVRIIKEYSDMQLITVPDEYNGLLYDDKLDVADNIIGMNFESDDEVAEFICNMLKNSDGSKVYYSWDFESASLKDNISGEEFMMDHPQDNVAERVVVTRNPTDDRQYSAMINFGASDKERLVFTDEINSDFKSGKIKYVVYAFDAYLPESKSLLMRISSGTKAVRAISDYFETEKWHSFLVVADVENSRILAYRAVNGKLSEVRVNSNISEMDFNRFSFMYGSSGAYVQYFDNITVKGYSSLYEEINEATQYNAVDVLNAFDSMGIIDFSEEYRLLTAYEKQKFIFALKAQNYANDEDVRRQIAKLFSGNELNVTNVSFGNDGRVIDVEVKINKKDVNAKNPQFVFASYFGNTLSDIRIIEYNGFVSEGDIITIPDINLKCEASSNIKLMLWEPGTSITPLTEATVIFHSK